jgi:hypothetical protein
MEFENLQSLIDKLLKNFYVLFFNNCLYICPKNLEKISNKKIKNILCTDNVFLTLLDETNLKHESDYVKHWCESFFIQKDIRDFENNEQKLLREYMNVLDDCEKQLEKIMKEGG